MVFDAKNISGIPTGFQKPVSRMTDDGQVAIAPQDLPTRGISYTPKEDKDIAAMVTTLLKMSGDRHLADERVPHDKRDVLLAALKEAQTTSGDSKKAVMAMVFLAKIVKDELTPEQKAKIENLLKLKRLEIAFDFDIWGNAKEAPENNPKTPAIEDALK